MTNKQAYIDFIVDELNKGNVSFERVFELFLTKFNCSRPTFSKYWKNANLAYLEQRKAIEKEKTDISTDAEKERLKSAILTKHERMEIATSIAKGKAWKVDNNTVIPTANDRLKALDYLSKVDGDYAAIKLDTEITVADKPKMKLPDGTEIEI